MLATKTNARISRNFLGVDVVQPYQNPVCKAPQGFDLGEIEAAEVSNIIIIDPCARC
jgi:hypothetical protein